MTIGPAIVITHVTVIHVVGGLSPNDMAFKLPLGYGTHGGRNAAMKSGLRKNNDQAENPMQEWNRFISFRC